MPCGKVHIKDLLPWGRVQFALGRVHIKDQLPWGRMLFALFTVLIARAKAAPRARTKDRRRARSLVGSGDFLGCASV